MTDPIARLGERLGALRYLPALFREIAAASPRLLAASLALRLVAAFLPILSLYLAKLILDGIVAEHARPAAEAGLADWLADPARARLAILVAAELGLALLSDLTGRLASLTETLIGDLYANAASVRLMAHAASLDLAQFEDSAQQDRLERGAPPGQRPHRLDRHGVRPVPGAGDARLAHRRGWRPSRPGWWC